MSTWDRSFFLFIRNVCEEFNDARKFVNILDMLIFILLATVFKLFNFLIYF